MVYASWKTIVKLPWDLPRQTKGYFIDRLFATNVTSPKVTLLSRCHKFFHRLLDSDSSEVQIVARLAARDLRSNLGRNLQYMREETGLDPWVYGNFGKAPCRRNNVFMADVCARPVPLDSRFSIPVLFYIKVRRIKSH